MSADDVGRLQPSRSGRWLDSDRARRRIRRFVIGTGLVGYSWMAGGTKPFSATALLSVLFPGAVIAVIAYGRAPERIKPPDSLDITGFSYWIVVLGALFEWEASAFRDNSVWSHPSLTLLVDPLIGPHPIKTIAFLLWLLAGWGLVRR